jgi:hypothetical protein
MEGAAVVLTLTAALSFRVNACPLPLVLFAVPMTLLRRVNVFLAKALQLPVLPVRCEINVS